MDLKHLLAAILFGFIVTETIGQSDRLATLILKRAIRRLAKNHVEHYSEVWASHLQDCPGPLSKLRHACGCWFISGSWRMEITTREYLAIRALGFVGRMTELHATAVLAKAWLIENAAKTLPEHLIVVARMDLAVTKLREVAAMQQQASRLFKMYEYVSVSPSKVEAGLLRSWLSSMGLCGGIAIYKLCADRYSDYCGFRRCFGIEVAPIKLKYSQKTLKMCQQGKEIIDLSSKLFDMVEQVKAQRNVG